jgi:DNA-binding NtrC family response regulator
LPLQGKLLRAVEERAFEPVGSDRSCAVRARLIAASNAPLEREVEAGRFRADLFYRLNVVGFFLPPLRDRRQSIVPLAYRFFRSVVPHNRPDVTDFSPAVLDSLEDHDWPGNVRELRNVVERAVALSPGPLIKPEDLPEVIRGRRGPAQACDAPLAPVAPSAMRVVEGPTTLAESKQKVEIQRILEALEKHKDNRVHAAAELGISRIALYKKLHKYGLMKPRKWR